MFVLVYPYESGPHYPHKQVVVSHERKNGPENFFDSTTRFLKHMNIL
jgi:hypothetical protein